MKDIKKIFQSFEKKLRSASWFDDQWAIYNRGPYLQLYKVNWFNNNQSGVHFETYIEKPQIRDKRFPICLHAEEDCPSYTEFIETLVAHSGDQIRSWKGYEVSKGTYSVCERNMPLNFKNLEDRLLEEFNRLRRLEPVIDDILGRR